MFYDTHAYDFYVQFSYLVFMSNMFVQTESELEVVLVGTQNKERYMYTYVYNNTKRTCTNYCECLTNINVAFKY